MPLYNIIRSLGFACLLSAALPVLANNVRVTNVAMSGMNTVSGTTQIALDVAWDNSWYDSDNHDAVWLFVKYRVNTGDNLWRHATLSTSGHVTTSGFSLDQANSKGVFLRRSGTGSGTADASGIELQWHFAVDPERAVPGGAAPDFIDPDDVLEVKVHAIEMVYVPEGPYDIGDGRPVDNSNHNQFHRADSATTPFRVTSENSLNLGGTSAANLCTTTGAGMVIDDFDAATVKTLPAAFPKGYGGFYLMKYKTSQEQYVEFLNSLTRIQQETRIANTDPNGYSLDIPGDQYSALRRLVIRPKAAPSGSTVPYEFVCDLNNNKTGNEPDDGQNLAVLGIKWEDAAAYLDWSGLRPMTEFEFEKACRGPLAAVPGEFPWGTTYLRNDDILLVNAGTASEIPDPAQRADSNCAVTRFGDGAPRRVGMHAGNNATESRESAGAGFYGAMDLAGNGIEQVVTASKPEGRSFTGISGDGQLDSAGNADVEDWPAASGLGAGFRGLILQNPNRYSTSCRVLLNGYPDPGSARTQYPTQGFRGAFTYPTAQVSTGGGGAL